MNPLDLRGPEFLAFYIAVASGVLALVVWRNARRDPKGPPPGRLTHPYRIAYLRSGAAEMLRVATLALLDRGLLRAAGDVLTTVPESDAVVTHPLERGILRCFRNGGAAKDVYTAASVAAAIEVERCALEQHGLLPDEALRAARARFVFVACLALGGLAFAKLQVALSRGRSVEFLFIAAVLAIVVVAKVGRPRLTRRGREVLEDLRVLFGGLRSRSAGLRPGGASSDATLLAAVFGVGVLANVPAFAYARELFPKAGSSDGTSSGACGSSCGSSSSCGGGGSGCGGGCGGCGG